MIHSKPSPLAGKKVKIIKGAMRGHEYHVEDWWDRVAGKSWRDCDGNPACLGYAMRTGLKDRDIPPNDEVLYGKVGALGHLIHISEVES